VLAGDETAAGSGDDRAFRPARDVPLSAMRLIVARCEVRYSGRLDALLPEALRLLMIKSDGSVMVHADTGGYKPQNCGLTQNRRSVSVPWLVGTSELLLERA
jgi:hypothetical protein